MTSYLFPSPTIPTPVVAPTSSRPWGFTVQVYKPTGPNTGADLFLFNYDDVPEKSFLVVSNIVVEADREVQLILEKTKTHNKTNTYVVMVC
jgi:hypothetical protein